MNAYLQLKKRQQDEIDNFPMFFAFSEEQFKKGIQKLNLMENDKDKLYKLGNTGGFIRKTDSDALSDMFERHSAEMKTAMKDKNFVFEMFDYELANHEYIITWSVDETLEVLNLTEEEVDNNPILSEGLKKAIEEQFKNN